MNTSSKVKVAISLGARIAELEQEHRSQIKQLETQYLATVGPLRDQMEALFTPVATVGPSPDGPQAHENARNIILGLLGGEGATLSTITEALYGPDYTDDRIYRGRASARISNLKKHFKIVKKGKMYVLDEPVSPSEENEIF